MFSISTLLSDSAFHFDRLILMCVGDEQELPVGMLRCSNTSNTRSEMRKRMGVCLH